MSRHNSIEINKYINLLSAFEQDVYPLPSIRQRYQKELFSKQIIDSIRRIQYVSVIENRPISTLRSDPNNELFDPIRAAILHKRENNYDEAFWLIFLFTHFGKHLRSKWRYLREVYGKCGDTTYWTWEQVSTNPTTFRTWLKTNQKYLTRGSERGFGGHRPYTSLDADKPAGTGAAIASYVAWIQEHGGHVQMIQNTLAGNQQDPFRSFDQLYKSMSQVKSFGRLAKFDYLTMLAKIGLAKIEPPKAYIADATGPKAGARLMLQGSVAANELSNSELEKRLAALSEALGVNMQVIEDSLCNWQKDPARYIYFRG